MTWPDGRTVAFTPRLLRRIMSGLYSLRTFKFPAFGHGVFENHQTYSTNGSQTGVNADYIPNVFSVILTPLLSNR